MRLLLPFLCLCIVSLSNVALADEASRKELLTSSKRVLFLGDSITHAGGYVADVITWAEVEFPKNKIDWINVGLGSETVSGLSEKGHAGGRFPRPDLHERLDRVLKQTKPDLVFACYGMNCGIQQPLDKERFAKYQGGIKRLQQEVEKTGVKIVFLTPPYYDKVSNPKKAYYTDVLATYSKWLLDRRADGWMVVDVNGAMTKAIEKRRLKEPKFSVQKDAVHPNHEGHWMMAQPVIAWFGDHKGESAESAEAMLKAKGKDPKIAQLCRQRMEVLRDAWLTQTGHKRPGVPKGKPIAVAQKIADGKTAEIEKLKTK